MTKRIQFKRHQQLQQETQFWPRVLAFMIDNFIVRILIIPVIVAGLAFSSAYKMDGISDKWTDIFLYAMKVNSEVLVVLYLIVWIAYSSLMESSRMQGTIGKWFMRYKVCNTDFNRISFKKALLRNTLKLVSMVSIVGVLIIDITPKRQGLHDLIVGTRLVRRFGVR